MVSVDEMRSCWRLIAPARAVRLSPKHARRRRLAMGLEIFSMPTAGDLAQYAWLPCRL